MFLNIYAILYSIALNFHLQFTDVCKTNTQWFVYLSQYVIVLVQYVCELIRAKINNKKTNSKHRCSTVRVDRFIGIFFLSSSAFKYSQIIELFKIVKIREIKAVTLVSFAKQSNSMPEYHRTPSINNINTTYKEKLESLERTLIYQFNICD